MTLQITTEANQYSLRVPAHRYWQGKRCVYYFALDLQSLDGLLPQRVDDGMVREANRRLIPSHAKNIQYYLRERDDWLLGAMMLGISPRAVEFAPYKDENGNPNINFGELRILANLWNTMRIFDGQHRRRAIEDLLLELADEEEKGEGRREELLRSAVPIALYAEDNLQSLRQMFADASKTKNIEASTVTRFDQRDAFNLAAMHLVEGKPVIRWSHRDGAHRSGRCRDLAPRDQPTGYRPEGSRGGDKGTGQPGPEQGTYARPGLALSSLLGMGRRIPSGFPAGIRDAG